MTVRHAVTKPMVVGIGGSTRPQPSGELALRYCLRIAEQTGTRTELIAAQDLPLPIYDPASTAPAPHTKRTIDLVHRADALVIAPSDYHAGISSLVKNTLEYLEDLRLADPPFLEARLSRASQQSRGAQGGAFTLAALRSVVHALRAWPAKYTYDEPHIMFP